MDQELGQKLAQLERKIEAVGATAEKTRKYFLWMLILSLVFLFLPLIGLMFALPMFFQALSVFDSL